MASPIDRPLAKGAAALRGLTIHLVQTLTEHGLDGRAIGAAIAGFARHRAKMLSGLLGTAGAAGGAWAALSLWTSSLGAWSGALYAMGLVGAPLWVPFAGGLAGLTAAGTAAWGALSLTRRRARTQRFGSVVGLSKILLGRDDFAPQDTEVLRRFLVSQGVAEEAVEGLLETPAATGVELAAGLSPSDRLEVARYIFPLVYVEAGVVTPAGRRRFQRVCRHLQLEAEAAREISAAYRQRLDRQWDYLRVLVDQLNYFSRALSLDAQELESLRIQVEQLLHFDPRRNAENRRQRLLAAVGDVPGPVPADLAEDPLAEAALMGAYALAHTVALDPEEPRLKAAFEARLDSVGIEGKPRKQLQSSRARLDRLYAATRREILDQEET